MDSVSFYWKCKNKVQLKLYYLESAKIRYGSEFVPLRKLK